MGTTYVGRTATGEEWTIKVVKDREAYQVIVLEASRFAAFREPNLYYAEQRVRHVICRRGYEPLGS